MSGKKKKRYTEFGRLAQLEHERGPGTTTVFNLFLDEPWRMLVGGCLNHNLGLPDEVPMDVCPVERMREARLFEGNVGVRAYPEIKKRFEAFLPPHVATSSEPVWTTMVIVGIGQVWRRGELQRKFTLAEVHEILARRGLRPANIWEFSHACVHLSPVFRLLSPSTIVRATGSIGWKVSAGGTSPCVLYAADRYVTSSVFNCESKDEIAFDGKDNLFLAVVDS